MLNQPTNQWRFKHRWDISKMIPNTEITENMSIHKKTNGVISRLVTHLLKIYLKIVDLRKSKCSIDSEIEMCVCALRQRWVRSVDVIYFFVRVRPFCEPNIWPKKRYWILDWNNKNLHVFEKRTHMQIVCILCFVSQLPIYCTTIL